MLPEAMEQIVNMYSEGVGVGRSLEKAAEWQQKLITLRSSDFEADPSAQNAVLLTTFFLNCAVLKRRVKRHYASLK